MGIFLTSKLVRAGRPKIFIRDEARYLLRSVLVYYKAQHHFRLLGYCFLPDRVHLIVQPSLRVPLPRIMKDVWGNFSRKVNKRWRRTGSVMRSKYLAEELADEQAVRDALHNLHKLPAEFGINESASGSPLTSSLQYKKGLGDMLVDLYAPPAMDRAA